MNIPIKIRKSAGVPVTPAVHRMLVDANRARDAHDWARAAHLYRMALDADPNLAHIWVQYGHALRASGAAAEAEAAYEKAIALRPEQSDPLVHLGHLNKERGDGVAASRAYLDAVRLDPDNGDAIAELLPLLAAGSTADRSELLAVVRTLAREEPVVPKPASGVGDAAERARAAMADLVAALRRDESGRDPAALEALATSASLLDTLTEAVDRRGGADAQAAPALVFDISDLISYFRNARLPTGIQRVQIETIRSALEEGRRHVRICAFQEHRDEWLEIPAATFLSLCCLSLAGGDRSESAWTGALARLHLLLATAEAMIFPEGAFLINLGTSWWLQNYFLFVRNAKAEYNIRYVPFVHDMIPVMAGEHCTKELTQDFISWAVGAFQHADFFLANSESTKRDLLKVAATLGHDVRADDVAVIRLDADFRRPHTIAAPKGALARWGLAGGDFVLFVSTIESRKNHLGAFEAWINLIREHGVARVPKLVCVGNRGWLNDAVYARLETHDGLRDRVVMRSGLSDGELELLYRSCLFTLYPSNYEGWGLPVTESLCHGKVPLLSDASSLPEAGGSFALYFEAGSVQRLTDALRRLIFDADFRRGLESRIAADFAPRQWRDIAEQIGAATAEWKLREPADQGGAPVAHLGAYHPIVRNFATRIWAGMRAAEIYRAGDGWWGPDDWGCWTKSQGARLEIGLPDIDEPLRVYLRLHGLPLESCPYEVRVEPGPQRFRGVLDRGAFKWITLEIDDPPADRIVRIHVKGESCQDLRDVTNGLDPRIVSAGVSGFFLCAADDTAARAAFLEAVALGNVNDLTFNRESPDNGF